MLFQKSVVNDSLTDAALGIKRSRFCLLSSQFSLLFGYEILLSCLLHSEIQVKICCVSLKTIRKIDERMSGYAGC